LTHKAGTQVEKKEESFVVKKRFGNIPMQKMAQVVLGEAEVEEECIYAAAMIHIFSRTDHTDSEHWVEDLTLLS
jgi:hypothetical protein